jgi:hypothetical protein
MVSTADTETEKEQEEAVVDSDELPAMLPPSQGELLNRVGDCVVIVLWRLCGRRGKLSSPHSLYLNELKLISRNVGWWVEGIGSGVTSLKGPPSESRDSVRCRRILHFPYRLNYCLQIIGNSL